MVKFTMSRPCSKLHSSIPSDPRLLATLLLGLVVFISNGVLAAEVPLRAFTASYDLTRSGMKLGTVELSLEPLEQIWRWRLTTQPSGLLAMVTNKKPYSETTFIREQDQIRLQQIIISDENDSKNLESASFDWKSRQMKVLRKGKHSSVNLTTEVYDYQSIHLLATTMQLQQLNEVIFNLYRKGKLVESRLVYRGKGSVKVGDRDTNANIFEQTTTKSKTTVKYSYDLQNPLLPLLIESRKGDDAPSTMTLRKVDWHS
jgi:hypothetical protein